jgi:hypothetical protein
MFANLVGELFSLLAEPDRQGVLTMADHLGGEDWWDKHRLGYGVVTTVASLQHWASRLKMVASMAKCLLGECAMRWPDPLVEQIARVVARMASTEIVAKPRARGIRYHPFPGLLSQGRR